MKARRLETLSVEKPWGRVGLPAPFGVAGDERRIGEIWFDGPTGEPPPLLVKHIFTSEKLSIQVHPNDDQGRARGLGGGKSECWLILDAQPGATLGIGTRQTLDGDELRAAALDGSIEALMDWKPVKPGDFFYIAAGTVHAIGAGVALVEVQQNVDVTYRLYDYGRPRELHLDDGVAVSRAAPYLRAPVNVEGVASARLLEENEAPFVLDLLTLETGTRQIGETGQGWFVPLTGAGTIGGEHWQAGECWLLDGPAEVTTAQTARVLVARL